MEIPNKSGKGRPSVRPSKEELAILYSEMRAYDIAVKFNVSEATVRGWLAYYRKQGSDNNE